jgi:hypothetical protein
MSRGFWELLLLLFNSAVRPAKTGERSCRGDFPDESLEPVLPDARNSNPVAAKCAKPARYGIGPRIPPRSSAPPATPSTVRSHSPMLPAHASARTRSTSSPLRSGGACVRRARLSSDRASPPLPVVAPTDSPIAGARRPAAPPRTDEFPWPATSPPATAGAPVPESLAVPPPDLPWADDCIAS